MSGGSAASDGSDAGLAAVFRVAIGVVGTSVKCALKVASGSFQSLAYDVSLKGTAENINGSKTAICSISASL